MIIDDNSLINNKKLKQLIDKRQYNDIEYQTLKSNLNYIKLNTDGNIVCLLNGRGITMYLNDIINSIGNNTIKINSIININDFDYDNKIIKSLKILFKFKNIKIIIINVLSNILDCNIISNTIIDLLKEIKDNIKIIIRLKGKNSKEANEKIKNINNIYIIDSLNKIKNKIIEISK